MDSQTKIYNGHSVRDLINACNELKMTREHKKSYIRNAIFVYQNEKRGYNLGYCNCVRNSNFNMVVLYRKLSGFSY